jgi:ankyrin repeat protein
MTEFCGLLSESSAEWQAFGHQTIILQEIFRILFDQKFGYGAQNINVTKHDIDKVRSLVAKSQDFLDKSNMAGRELTLLDLVWLGKNPATGSFLDGDYTVSVLNPRKLYRAGKNDPSRKLGQYWTLEKPPDISSIRRNCAVKDDWEIGAVTLDEVFAPNIDAVYTFEVKENLVAFEGKAAPLHTFMNVDGLAKEVFCGGGHQVLIVSPWNIPTRLPTESALCEPLTGNPWSLLDYDPTQLCKSSYGGYFEYNEAEITKEQETIASINGADGSFGFTPLHYACMSREDRSKTIKLLLERGAEPCQPSQTSAGALTPLVIAAMVGITSNIRALLAFSKQCERNDLFKAEQQNGRSPLHFAAKLGHAEALKAMLESKCAPTPDPVDKLGCTPLWVACRHGRKDAAQALIDFNANINHDLCLQKEVLAATSGDASSPESWDENKHFFLQGTTPLHTAVLSGHSDVVKLLICDAQDRCKAPQEGLDLLHRAVAAGYDKVAEVLAVHGHRIKLDVNAGRQWAR